MARDYTPIDLSKEQLKDLYVNRNMSAYQISVMHHCSERKISNLLRKAGIPTKRLPKQSLKNDLIGSRFERLLVVRKSHVDDKGDVFWECKCDCGTTIVTRARNLLREGEGSRSCGCKKTRIPWKIIPQFIWGVISSKARIRNIPFKITREFGEKLYERQQGECALSGEKIWFSSRRSGVSQTTASLDRIDSSGDYTEDNVQWVHKIVNGMKQSFDTKTFLDMCTKIADHQRERT